MVPMSTRLIGEGSLLAGLLELLPGKSTVKLERSQHTENWEVTVTVEVEPVRAKIVVVHPKLKLAIIETERLVDELLDTATEGERPGLFHDAAAGSSGDQEG